MNVFRERLCEHHSQTFSVDAELHRGHTGLQEVLIFENRIFGRVLALDGIVQLTDRDNHIYHEMIAHVPLMAHGSAARVLIIGGGDGGTLGKVLEHPVEQVVMVELDRQIIELSRRYFPQVSNGAFDDRRLELVIGDGVDYVRQAEAGFDVVIVDSTDPVGPGEPLFTRDFYERCRALLGPEGVIALQSGAAFYTPEQLGAVCRRLRSSFEAARPFLAPVPTYAGGMLALVAAGQSFEALCPPVETLRERFQRLTSPTAYYTPEVHGAAFALAPAFAPELPARMNGLTGVRRSPSRAPA